MRCASLILLFALGLAACADDEEGPTSDDGPGACEVGPEIVAAAKLRVSRDQPACSEDSDCVRMSLDVTCSAYSTSHCDHVLHRAAAAAWDPARVCREIDRASVPNGFSCSEEAACRDPGTPVCRDSRCAGSASGTP